MSMSARVCPESGFLRRSLVGRGRPTRLAAWHKQGHARGWSMNIGKAFSLGLVFLSALVGGSFAFGASALALEAHVYSSSFGGAGSEVVIGGSR